MNNYMLLSSLLIFFIFTNIQTVEAQSGCVDCSGCSVTGNQASAIGTNNTASGNNSFAGGYNSRAAGSNSFSFGYNSKALQSTTTAIGNCAEASGASSIAIGSYAKASAQNSIAIGYGPTSSSPLTNSTPYSIALGAYSNLPTLLITKSTNKNYTGKVIIGNATTAKAKLYVTADDNEDADLFLEPKNKTSHKAAIKIFDSDHSLSVNTSGELTLTSVGTRLTMINNCFHFGKSEEKMVHIYPGFNSSLMVNASRVAGQEKRDFTGSAFAIDFRDNALCLRTSASQEPRGSVITNWKETLLLGTDGKVGIGSLSTYLVQDEEGQLTLHSNRSMNLESNTIFLEGNVGINTVNTTGTYALAVDGGIISTKIHIKEAHQWPDYVFSEDYSLMGLKELKTFIEENQHLPGMPSEEQVEQQGYDLNDMTSKLLEKVEELTRYILFLQDEIESLRQEHSHDSTVHFDYDANGNRISRSLTIERIVDGEQPIAPLLNGIAYEIYPNPTEGQIMLQLSNELTGNWQAHLFSSSGILLETKEMDSRMTGFDLSSKPSGTYLLKLTDGEEQQVWKIVKQ